MNKSSFVIDELSAMLKLIEDATFLNYKCVYIDPFLIN